MKGAKILCLLLLMALLLSGCPSNTGDPGDPYPGASDNRAFTDSSTPNSKLHDGTPSGVAVTNISDPGSIMTVTFTVPDAGLSPHISVKPSKLRFKAKVGESLTKDVTISNKGDAPLEVISADSSKPEFSVVSPEFPQTVLPGKSIKAEIEFTPTKNGKIEAKLTIESNDPNKPKMQVKLVGTGKGKEAIGVGVSFFRLLVSSSR